MQLALVNSTRGPEPHGTSRYPRHLPPRGRALADVGSGLLRGRMERRRPRPARAAREGNAMVARPDSAEVPTRRRNPDLTREEILDVAVREFARNGLAGARVDEIAAQTRTTKRMIYYYFGGKEQLFIAALERVYSLFPRCGGAARRRSPRPGRGDQAARSAHPRPSRGASGLHQAGRHREHSPGREHQQVRDPPPAEQPGDHHDRADTRSWLRRRRVPACGSTRSTCT